MKSPFSLSAFFPCYNDVGTIASMVALTDLTLQSLTEDYEILVVDDGSSDHSRAILSELEKKYDRLKVVYHEKNKGYGGALKAGFSSATKEFLFYTDGDFQYDVSEITKLLPEMKDGIDIVNGYKIGRSDRFYRKIIGKTYHWIMNLLFSFKIRDVDCDFRLIRMSVFDKIQLEYNSGVICVEMVRKMQDAGFQFAEVPVNHYFRAYGRSQYFNLKRVFNTGIDILKLWWKLVIKKEG